MRAFQYVKATSPAHAVQLAERGGRFIAGGTNLLDLMKVDVERPALLIDISRLNLDKLEATADGGLAIGALVPNSDLAAHPVIRSDYAVLARALLAGASGQIRNKATTGGNLLQRTRCYYFYQPHLPCNKREPGSGCAALEGFNRIHAILGATPSCIATHPSDMAVAMTALDASVEILGADGDSRVLKLRDLYRLPGEEPERDTHLNLGELIVRVMLPKELGGIHVYRKVRDRASYAFALVSVAAVIDQRDGRINTARLALGGVAAMPWRKPEVERILIGQPASATLFAQAADNLLEGAVSYGKNGFKINLARRTIIAALSDASGLSA